MAQVPSVPSLVPCDPSFTAKKNAEKSVLETIERSSSPSLFWELGFRLNTMNLGFS